MMDIHPIFYISLLEPMPNNPLPSQIIAAPVPIIIEGELEYEVEQVIDSLILECQLQYLINRHGWDIQTW
jgi:hypothetical protein